MEHKTTNIYKGLLAIIITMNKEQEQEQEHKKFITRIRKENKNRFPIVMKNKEGTKVQIIYSNRVEFFDLKSKETKKELDETFKDSGEKEWTPYIEIEMANGSGYKRVNDTTEKDDWRFN